MESTLIQDLTQLALAHGYWILFVGTAIEGALMVFIFSALASVGYFNIWFVFLVGTAGLVVADLGWFFLGHYGGERFVNRFGKYILLHPERFTRIERYFDTHGGKILFFLKFIHGVGIPTLLAAGASSLSPRRASFAIVTSVTVWVAVLAVTGFFFGAYWEVIKTYWHIASLVIISVMLVLFFSRRYLGNLIFHWNGNGTELERP